MPEIVYVLLFTAEYVISYQSAGVGGGGGWRKSGGGGRVKGKSITPDLRVLA